MKTVKSRIQESHTVEDYLQITKELEALSDSYDEDFLTETRTYHFSDGSRVMDCNTGFEYLDATAIK